MSTRRRMLPSTKILIGAIVLGGGTYWAYDKITTQMIMTQKFAPIEPGVVNIVGVDTNKGYYILVSNQIAQLVIGDGTGGKFEAPEKSEGGDPQNRKRIPLREMLLSLNGDTTALGKFVMTLNNMNEGGLPTQPVVWKAEDIQLALDGDAALRSKLEQDVNQKLDGRPIDSLKVSGIQEGIVLDSPVKVKVRVGAEIKELTARIREEYRTRLMKELDKTLAEKVQLTQSMISGYYQAAVKQIEENPGSRENIQNSLTGLISSSRLQRLAILPEKILTSVKVVVNNDLMTNASSQEFDTPDGKKFNNMKILLNEEGRRRLWQYTKQHVGTQILLVSDGIAISAPKISHEIAFPEVKISNLPDRTLVEDTVNAINELAQEKNRKV